MAHAVRQTMRSLRASPIFSFYALATLGIAGVIGLITVGIIDMGFSHFGEPFHRTHDLTYGLLFTTGVVGIVAQLRRPAKNVASMVMALIPWAALALAASLASDPGVIRSAERISVASFTVITALLHPTGRAFFRSFSLSRVSRKMLALVGAASVPLLAFASTNIELQKTVTDDHGGMGHYGFMAAFSFTVIAVGLLASLRPDGWRLPAWVAGLLPALLGAISILYPDATSSVTTGWAFAAIAWGVTFVATAARTKDPKGPNLPGSRGAATEAERPLEAQLSK
jgi:hypothetical protein